MPAGRVDHNQLLHLLLLLDFVILEEDQVLKLVQIQVELKLSGPDLVHLKRVEQLYHLAGLLECVCLNVSDDCFRC